MNICGTVVWVHGVLWCAKVQYCTRFGSTVGKHVPVHNPNGVYRFRCSAKKTDLQVTHGNPRCSTIQPRCNQCQCSLFKGHCQQLLALEVNTPPEYEYQTALHEVGLQGAALLQACYCNTLQSQLMAQEEKSRSKKEGKVMGMGCHGYSLIWILSHRCRTMRMLRSNRQQGLSLEKLIGK